MESPKEDLNTLISFGFSEAEAVEALAQHPDDIEAATNYIVNIQETRTSKREAKSAEIGVVDLTKEEEKVRKSFKCVTCSKVEGKKYLYRTIQDLNLHAEKSGHQDFEESEQEVKKLTPEELKEKVEQLELKLKQKRIEREKREKKEAIEREKLRRLNGQKHLETREKMELEKKKRDREKERAEEIKNKLIKEEEIKKFAAQLANQEKSRAVQQGKSIQEAQQIYDSVYMKRLESAGLMKTEETAKSLSFEEKLNNIIKAMNVLDHKDSIKATLKKILLNVIQNPHEEKYRKLKTSNPAFQKRVGKFASGVMLLKLVGFEKKNIEGVPFLLMPNDTSLEPLRQVVKRI
eukprot:augustus_masked-scaffold_18-processed-gene-5.7-mRNA-1 protein AED:0.36 eAED:0.44 QI:0/-1/0/1/-1/1/1/0/347